MNSVLPADASSFGWRTDATLRLLAAGTALLALVAVALLTVAVLRGARRKAPSPLAARVWPAAAAAMALLMLELGVGSLAQGDLAARRREPSPNALRIEVLAQRWSWSARYAGADGRFGTEDDVVSPDALRVPRGREVALGLAARDVLHSFFAPALRLKQDAIPERNTYLWFQAERSGDYPLLCAELCGVGHGAMRGVVRVLEPSHFEAWLAHAQRDALRLRAAGASREGWGWPWPEGASSLAR